MKNGSKWTGVTAANGNGSYTFDPAGFAPGTYYVGGYMYDRVAKTSINSHLTSPITIPATILRINRLQPRAHFTAGQNITITWTAANVPANSVISLCLDYGHQVVERQRKMDRNRRCDRREWKRLVHLQSDWIRPGHVLHRRIHVRHDWEDVY